MPMAVPSAGTPSLSVTNGTSQSPPLTTCSLSEGNANGDSQDDTAGTIRGAKTAQTPNQGTPPIKHAKGDYDGDGKTDIAYFNPSAGTWTVSPSGNPAAWYSISGFASGIIPLPGDYDGDGKTDIAYFNPSAGTWTVSPSSNPAAWYYISGFASGIVPLPGDYDGDGKTDIAYFNPSGGTWTVSPSSNPAAWYYISGFASGIIPVPGDYDGDGKTDISYFNPSGGTWTVSPSGNPAAWYYISGFASGIIPVPGDYDGDGKTDISSFNPSGGTWTVSPSSNPAAWYYISGFSPVPIPLTAFLATISGQVLAGGSSLSGIDMTLSDALSGSLNTDTNGNYSFVVSAGGNYKLTPSLAGFSFSPASQTFSNLSGNQTAQKTTAAGGSSTPPTCQDIAPGYLGTFQSNGPGQITVTATVSTSVTKVNFQIYNEQTQSVGSASTFVGSLSPSSDVLGSNQYTVSFSSSQFQALGSYAVTAQVQGSSGHQASCSLSTSAFFAIVNDTAEPSNLNGKNSAGCGSLAGSWTDHAGIQSGEATDRWDLTQSGTTISGTQTVSNGPACGNIIWQVSGSVLDATKGTFTVTAKSPSVAEDQCGWVSATNVTINPLTVSASACDSVSGTENDTYPAGYGSDNFSTNWTTTATVPTGETSQFDQWGPDGYSNQGLFKGLLTTSTGAAEFSGRQVREYFPADLADGCAQLDPFNVIGAKHVAGAGAIWTVQVDSTYTDDWIGYDPPITRYYQARVGTCNLIAPQQVMKISSDNNQWVQYKTNTLEYNVTQTGVTAKRDTQGQTPASQARTYPK